MVEAIFTKQEYLKKDANFRIGAIISDGMWYTTTKWRKLAKVDEETLNNWIDRHMANGMLVQDAGGAKAYRFPLTSIKQWYREHGYEVGDQIIDFLFPARVWDEMTEAEGFLGSPLREIGFVTFECEQGLAEQIIENLRGLARVREIKSNTYRAYCLDAQMVKDEINRVLTKYKLPSVIVKEKTQSLSSDRHQITYQCSKSLHTEEIEPLLEKTEGHIIHQKQGDESKPETFRYVLYGTHEEAKQLVADIESVFEPYLPNLVGKVRIRPELKRRELIDFSKEFSNGLVDFYKTFARSLVKRNMDTIRIFLPDPEDQEAQIVEWVILAIEKYNEMGTVPFSAYLHNVLNHWPYDLPTEHLGTELSNFQRSKKKAVKTLMTDEQDVETDFSNTEIAEAMKMDRRKYEDLNEQDRMWRASKQAATLTWEETGEEKIGVSLTADPTEPNTERDLKLVNQLSVGAIKAVLETELYADAMVFISQIDSNELNLSGIQDISDDYIQSLGTHLSLEHYNARID